MGIVYGKRDEDYLEGIYRIELEKGFVRVKDLADLLGVKPPTVVEKLRKLAEKGLIIYEKHENIRLTPRGRELAKKLLERHNRIREFLEIILMIPKEIAEKDACYIEHGVHEITLERITKFLEFIRLKMKAQGYVKFLNTLKYFYEHGKLPNECMRRLGLTEEG